MVAGLGTHLLEQSHSILLHESLELGFRNCLDGNIFFVGQDHDLTVWFFVLVDFLNPEGTHFLKADFVIQCVDQYDCIGAPVVSRDDGPKGFGPSSIPDLHLYLLAFDFECLEFEVNPNGREEVLGEDIIYESEEEGAFTNSGATCDDDLVSLIVVFEHYLFLVIIVTIIKQSHKKYHRIFSYSKTTDQNLKNHIFPKEQFSFSDRMLLKVGSLVEKIFFLDLKMVDSVQSAQKALQRFFCTFPLQIQMIDPLAHAQCPANVLSQVAQYPIDSGTLGTVLTSVHICLTKSNNHTSASQFPLSQIPPASTAIPFLLIILNEWSFRGHGFSLLVVTNSHFLNLMSKFWPAFPKTLIKIKSLFMIPFSFQPPKLKTPYILIWFRRLESSSQVWTILWWAIFSLTSAWFLTEKMRGLTILPPVKVMKQSYSLYFYFSLMPPLIMIVVPKRVVA